MANTEVPADTLPVRTATLLVAAIPVPASPSGKGKVVIDGEEISLAAGDWLKISPVAKRQFFAASNSEITYICIQVKENSLEGYTATDAVIY